MAKFKQVYNEDDIKNAMKKGEFYTPGFLAKRIGCARSTCLVYLEKLEIEGNVVRCPVDEGQSYVWSLTEK